MKKDFAVFALIPLLTTVAIADICVDPKSSERDPDALSEYIYIKKNPVEPGRILFRYCHRPGNCEKIGDSARGYTHAQLRRARERFERARGKTLLLDTEIAVGGALVGAIGAVAFAPELATGAVAAETTTTVAVIATRTGWITKAASTLSKIHLPKNEFVEKIGEKAVTWGNHFGGVGKKIMSPQGITMIFGSSAATFVSKIPIYFDFNQTNFDNPVVLANDADKYLSEPVIESYGSCTYVKEPVSVWVQTLTGILKRV